MVFIMFATSSAAVDETDRVLVDEGSSFRNANAAGGWTIFMGIVVLIYEILFIVSRFLNFEFMTAFRTIVLLTVSILYAHIIDYNYTYYKDLQV